MDKQMIEEMAKVIADSCVIRKTYVNSHYPDRQKDMYYSLAEELLKYYQPKIPEDAVVLTGTKTEEHLEDLLIEFDEMSFYPATLMPNAEECAREWKRKLIYVIGQLRKETAEKFAEMLKAECERIYFENTAYIEICDKSKIDKVCKKIRENKNDGNGKV